MHQRFNESGFQSVLVSDIELSHLISRGTASGLLVFTSDFASPPLPHHILVEVNGSYPHTHTPDYQYSAWAPACTNPAFDVVLLTLNPGPHSQALPHNPEPKPYQPSVMKAVFGPRPWLWLLPLDPPVPFRCFEGRCLVFLLFADGRRGVGAKRRLGLHAPPCSQVNAQLKFFTTV